MHMQGSLQWVHAQGHVHPWAVGEEGGQSRLHKQAEDQDSVPVGQEQNARGKKTSHAHSLVSEPAAFFSHTLHQHISYVMPC